MPGKNRKAVRYLINQVSPRHCMESGKPCSPFLGTFLSTIPVTAPGPRLALTHTMWKQHSILTQGDGEARVPDLGGLRPKKKKFDSWGNGPERQSSAQIERKLYKKARVHHEGRDN
jgi:hypothetical protein